MTDFHPPHIRPDSMGKVLSRRCEDTETHGPRSAERAATSFSEAPCLRETRMIGQVVN